MKWWPERMLMGEWQKDLSLNSFTLYDVAYVPCVFHVKRHIDTNSLAHALAPLKAISIHNKKPIHQN